VIVIDRNSWGRQWRAYFPLGPCAAKPAAAIARPTRDSRRDGAAARPSLPIFAAAAGCAEAHLKLRLAATETDAAGECCLDGIGRSGGS